MGKGKAYSQDLVRLLHISRRMKLSRKEIKEYLRVDPKTIKNYVRMIEMYGDTRSYSQLFGRKPRRKNYNAHDLSILLSLIASNNGQTYNELSAQLMVQCGKQFSKTTMIRMMEEILHTRKKATIRAYEADQVCIDLHFMGLLGIDRGRLKFGDEVHVDTTNSCAFYGYTLRRYPVVNVASPCQFN